MNDISFYKVSGRHTELLFAWQQNPSTRQFARNSNSPTWEEHLEWMADDSPYFQKHAFMVVEGAYYVGMIAFVATGGGEYEISIIVAPGLRGRGIGAKALVALKREVRELVPDCQVLTAYIKPENIASLRLFAGAGFQPRGDGWHEYRLNGVAS